LFGIDDGAVFPVRNSGLCALVSRVALAPFRAANELDEVSESSWVAQAVRAHESVAKQALDQGPILPLRFGTLYSSDASVASALEQHRTMLLAELQRLGRGTEWSLSVSLSRVDEQPGIAPARQRRGVEVGQQSSGTAWMTDRQGALQSRQRRREQFGAGFDDVQATMRAHAREVVASTGTSGTRRDVLALNFLVDDVEQFQSAFASVRARYSPQGFAFRLSGPWPPYHFVRLAELTGPR
jgi:hypothetical protein